MDTLTFGHEHRKVETFKNSSKKSERKYIDFIVSGKSLGQLLRIKDFDLIGTFGWSENKKFENIQIDEFLGITKSELETGRTCFFVCPECGDIGCGAITAKIEVTDKNVIWKEFGYESNILKPDLSDYKEFGPFTFDKMQYFKILEGLKSFTIE
jgi:hypothetical protein